MIQARGKFVMTEEGSQGAMQDEPVDRSAPSSPHGESINL